MIIAQNKIIPPQQWLHDSSIKNNQSKTVLKILEQNQMPTPNEWYIKNNEKKNTYSSLINYYKQQGKQIPSYLLSTQSRIKNENNEIFQQALYGQIPEIKDHNPEEQNCDGFTIAMCLAWNNINIPKQWYHNPNIQNIYGDTVAMIQAKKGRIPDEHWNHNNLLMNKDKFTVTTILLQQNIKPSRQWYINPAQQDNEGYTQAMRCLQKQIQIPKYLYHDPLIRNKDGYTFALLCASQGYIPENQWNHNKYIRVKFNTNQNYRNEETYQYLTVQNFLQKRRLDVPQQWQYDQLNEYEDSQAMIFAKQGKIPQIKTNNPLQRNILGQTVGIILASKNIYPPKQWMHDIDLQDVQGNSIKSYLSKAMCIFKDNQIIINYQTEILNDTCQICLTDGKQEFIKSKCGHHICKDCFYQLYSTEQHISCPVCRNQNWFYPSLIENK